MANTCTEQFDIARDVKSFWGVQARTQEEALIQIAQHDNEAYRDVAGKSNRESTEEKKAKKAQRDAVDLIVQNDIQKQIEDRIKVLSGEIEAKQGDLDKFTKQRTKTTEVQDLIAAGLFDPTNEDHIQMMKDADFSDELIEKMVKDHESEEVKQEINDHAKELDAKVQKTADELADMYREMDELSLALESEDEDLMMEAMMRQMELRDEIQNKITNEQNSNEMLEKLADEVNNRELGEKANNDIAREIEERQASATLPPNPM